ncbi:MAG: 2-oxo acid dehydrogenase subunit E2 [Oscillospiraceae bacterium]|nr:2-oxo acid dehydrogenase subunit E2 [Oscillospiraceae bacterium]
MGRSDGKLVKDLPALDRIVPHLMDRRYDATNFAKFEFDMTNLAAFLKRLRAEGHKVGVMDVVMMAYARLAQGTPELNRFVVNKKIYQRNHLCISFTMLRREGDRFVDTVVKIYIEPEDDLLTVSQKIREGIKENEQIQTRNVMDRFADGLMSIPILPGFLISVIKWMDRRGILPKSIVHLSPFHTSMFLSNLGSIQMDYIYHHIYEFGTTSLFITMGKPRRVVEDGQTKRMMTLGIAMDERICKGVTWVRLLFEFRRLLENPEQMMGEQKAREAIGVK